MSFYLANNRVLLTNSNGIAIFDTNYKMPIVTEVLTGTLSLPDRVAGNDFNNYALVDYDIGASQGGPYDFVIGACSYTSTYIIDRGDYQGVTRSNLIGDFSGSVIAQFSNTNYYSPTDYLPDSVRVLSPIVSNGKVYIREEAKWNYGYMDLSKMLLGFDFHYKLYLGIYK